MSLTTLMTLSLEELECIREQIAEAVRREAFTFEELSAMREQYEESREQLEWQLQIALARVRDLEGHHLRSAPLMRARA